MKRIGTILGVISFLTLTSCSKDMANLKQGKMAEIKSAAAKKVCANTKKEKAKKKLGCDKYAH
jgi:hypothetical protein